MPKFSPIHFMDFILHQSNNLELVLPMSCRECTTIDHPPPQPSSPQNKKEKKTMRNICFLLIIVILELSCVVHLLHILSA